MKVCFIGSHLGLPEEELSKLEIVLHSLIKIGCCIFYCGCYGKFDWQVVECLFKLKKDYPKLRIVKIKPYYQFNRFLDKHSEKLYKWGIEELRAEYSKDKEGYDRNKSILEREVYYKKWFEDEKKYFDETMLCDLDNKPYKTRIIECNKWKIDECDILVSYCPLKQGNSVKIKNYALKKNKKVIELNQ